MDSSPCINSGSAMSSTEIGELDLNGNIRVNRIVDIGAFESLIIVNDNGFRLKENGQWVNIIKIYKKINGVWTIQEPSTWETLFDINTKYIALT